MVIIIFLGLIFSIISWRIYKFFLNPLTVYTIIWTVMVCLFELKLIEYYALSKESIFVLVLSYISLWIGTLTSFLLRKKVGQTDFESKPVSIIDERIIKKKLRSAIFILTCLASIAIIFETIIKISDYGLTGILNQKLIYSSRLEGEPEASIPYLGSLIYASLSLLGIYVGKFGFKLSVIIFPSIILGINSINAAGRAGLVISIVLFLSSYYLTSYVTKKRDNNNSVKVSSFKKSLAIISVLLVLLGVFNFISSNRGVISYYGTFENEGMDTLREINPIFPSIYVYLSAPPGVLSEYLKSEALKGETNKELFGEITFASFYRFLQKFGFDLNIDYYIDGYYIPIWINTGTYLREIHSDFGYIGVALIPYILGVFSGVLWRGVVKRSSISYIIRLSYIYSILVMSYMTWVVKLTYWIIPLIVSITICWYIERVSSKTINKITDKY